MSKRPTVGSLIRTAREAKGMTQHELGAKLGMGSIESSQVQISRYENDVVKPPTATIVKIARILKIPIQEMTDAVVRDETRKLRAASKST